MSTARRELRPAPLAEAGTSVSARSQTQTYLVLYPLSALPSRKREDARRPAFRLRAAPRKPLPAVHVHRLAAGVPTRRHLPLCSSTMRSENSAAKSSSCVTTRTVWRVSSARRRSRRSNSTLPPMSRCCVGSSSSKSAGCCASALRQNHALFLAAGKLVHPAVAQGLGAHLRRAHFPPSGNRHRIQSEGGVRADTGLARRIPRRAAGTGVRFPAAPSAICCARVRRSSVLTSWPSTSTRPARGFVKPAINRRRVDFPLAFGPRIATNSCGCASKLAGPSVNVGAERSVGE